MNKFKSLRKLIFENPHLAILTISFLWGLCLIATIPPFQSPDEEIHFLRSWAMSRGSLISKNFKTDTGTIKGYETPICAIELIEKTGFSKIVFHPEKKADGKQILKALKDRVSCQDLSYFEDWMNALNPVSYFKQVVSIWTTNLLDLPPLWSLYIARFLNLICAIFIIYLALRIAPVGKNIIAIFSVLPLPVSIFASMSHDATLIPLSFLYFALILKASLSKSRFNAKELLVLSLTVFAFFFVKGVYLPLALAFLAIPVTRFGNDKRRIGFFISFFAIALIAALISSWMWNATGGFGKTYGANPGAQLEYLINNPFDGAKVLIRTLNRYCIEYIFQIIGVVGYLDTRFHTRIYIAFIILVFFFLKPYPGNEEVALTNRMRIIFLVSAILTTVVELFSMYLTNNTVGKEVIDGPQGRIFYPCLPFLFIGFYGINIRKNKRIAIFLAGLVILIILAQREIIKRFWG